MMTQQIFKNDLILEPFSMFFVKKFSVKKNPTFLFSGLEPQNRYRTCVILLCRSDINLGILDLKMKKLGFF
jgi:hypothetical protein